MLFFLILAALFDMVIVVVVIAAGIKSLDIEPQVGTGLFIGIFIGLSLLLTVLFLYSPGIPSREFPEGIWKVEWVKEANQDVFLVLCTNNCSTIRLIQVQNDKIPEVSPGDLLIWDEKTEKAVKVQ